MRARAATVMVAFVPNTGGVDDLPGGSPADAQRGSGAKGSRRYPAGTTPPADTVMVASETMPGGVGVFPELLASSHQALLQGLPMTPSISQGLPATPVTTETEPKPLTGKDRLTLFWNDPMPHRERSWGLPPAHWWISSGIPRRSGMETKRLHPAFRQRIRPAGHAQCHSRWLGRHHRARPALRRMQMSGHAEAEWPRPQNDLHHVSQRRSAFARCTAARQRLRLRHDLYVLVSPQPIQSLVQGVQFGHEQMGEILIGNMVHEFGPDMERHLHLHALTARRHPRPTTTTNPHFLPRSKSGAATKLHRKSGGAFSPRLRAISRSAAF